MWFITARKSLRGLRSEAFVRTLSRTGMNFLSKGRPYGTKVLFAEMSESNNLGYEKI
jgi:hypothetical protein